MLKGAASRWSSGPWVKGGGPVIFRRIPFTTRGGGVVKDTSPVIVK